MRGAHWHLEDAVSAADELGYGIHGSRRPKIGKRVDNHLAPNPPLGPGPQRLGTCRPSRAAVHCKPVSQVNHNILEGAVNAVFNYDLLVGSNLISDLDLGERSHTLS